MKIIKTKGVVIKEVKTGEADKIVTIFSEKLGIIQAIAKGARRPQSRLIAGTQFLSFSNFVLYGGKEVHSIRECEVIESFYNMRNDLVKITYASYITDLVYEVSEESVSNYNLLKLVLNTLYMLSNTEESPELIATVFELRLMSSIGYKPQVEHCVNCGSKDELRYFNPSLGGLLCQNCTTDNFKNINISNSSINAIKYIIQSDMNKIFSFRISNEVLEELKMISRLFLTEHLDKKFEKLNFLDTIRMSEHHD